jgi:thiamine pyrophosphokinase
MRTLILANGEPPTRELARQLVAEHDLLVATDGAAHRALVLGLTPHIVCGDFDSVRLAEARAALPQTEFIATPDQDRADLEKAIQVARDRGATAITITGAAGGRIDHTLAGFALLLRYHGEIPIRIVDDGSEVWAVSGPPEAPVAYRFAATPGDTISLLSLDGQARVTVAGVNWPLENHPLAVGTHGISNVATADQIQLQVRGGTVLVCRLAAG